MMTTVREFTVPDFERLTPDLAGPERLAVFLGLPCGMQEAAWRELGERIERRSRELLASDRLGGVGTEREIAAEIAAIWPEIEAVPLGPVGEDQDVGRDRHLHGDVGPDRGDRGDDLDLLRSIPSAEFVPALTGREAVRGFVRCPLHAGGEERSASLHVSDDDGRWHCFACQAGGDIFDLAAALDGRSGVPTGREFMDFAREVAAAVAGARTWR